MYKVVRFQDGTETLIKEDGGVDTRIYRDESPTVEIVRLETEPELKDGKYITGDAQVVDLREKIDDNKPSEPRA